MEHLADFLFVTHKDSISSAKIRLLMIVLLLCCLFLSSCDNDSSPMCNCGASKIVVKGGTFFGECAGYCKTEIEICKTSVVFTASSWNDPDFPDTSISGTVSGEEWNLVVDAIDMELLLEFEDVIGCPDCADGGGEWIEVTFDESAKKITFEYGDTLEPIQILIDQLRIIRERFQCDMFPEYCQ